MLGGAQNAPGAQLMQSVLRMMMGGAQGGQAANPLGALLETFTKAGLGPQMNSWIGTGQNLPIDPAQIAQAFGADKIAAMAQSVGLSQADAARQLSEMLPQFVDRMTPMGQLPSVGLEQMLQQGAGVLGQLLKR
ncbi:MAG: DUF937 domain-containing protein [Alphaproteobacteria bacterium]|nr:DUF937 domain-containing protein [Alphaproteobacteria bacterium]MBM3643935.1 DUF937 domain-containing protein [Alphaproteobacteria bacterium]